MFQAAPPVRPSGGPPQSAPPQPPKRRRRKGLLITVVCLVVLALAGAGLVVVAPGPLGELLGRGKGDSGPPRPPAALPSPVLVAGDSIDPPAPTAEGVNAVLRPLLQDTDLGPHVTVSVVDVRSNTILFAQEPDTPTTPASTTKLVTAVTVLAARGPAYRIPTIAVAGANPGEVVLVGGGDPTLATGTTGSYPGAARLDLLAAQVKQALGGTAPTSVIADASLFTGPTFGPGWDDDIPTGGFAAPIMALMTDGGRVDPKNTKGIAERYGQPDLAAAQAFAEALGLPTSAVQRGKAPATTQTQTQATAPATTGSGSPVTVTPGAVLGRVESPPLSRLVDIMLVDSDNVIAEMLARQVALARQQPASYAGAAAAMKAVLGELGLPVAESGLVDGSGLSRTDRLTPSLLTDVVALAARADRPELRGIFSGLPVAGYSGTLKDRYQSPGPASAGAGLVRAKTGTLTGVSTISGVVVTKEGRTLAFAVLADQVPGGGTDAAQEALDTVATALAACGCR